MAATDMRKAGLEPGCKVVIVPEYARGSYSAAEMERCSRAAAKSPWTYQGPTLNSSAVLLNNEQTEDSVVVWDDMAVRDFEDAQTARQNRLDVLGEHYPSDATPENTDTIERYCGVNCFFRWDQREQRQRAQWWWHFSDDFAEVCSAMADIGEMPEAIFDLDTGDRIDLHVSVTITRGEDQHTCVNVLQRETETA